MPTKNIEPDLRAIGDYLNLNGSNDTFVIPEYQRGYSWTLLNCDKLWQDLESFIESGADDPYFFGTIIIDCSSDNCMSLIDGQQRTTTFLLLLKALHLRLKDTLDNMQISSDTRALQKGLERSVYKILEILYKADEDRQNELDNDWSLAKSIVILQNKSINELYKSDFNAIISAASIEEAERNVYKIPRKRNDNKYTNFFRNFKFFYSKLLEYSETRLNNFAKVFLGKCQIIEIKSWNIEQAITMFNSLNSTGMPLSDADIISAQLYSHADDKNAYITQWKHITELANDLSQRRIVNIDSILQQFMYYNRALNKQYRNGDVTVPGVRKYYTLDHKELLEDPVSLCNTYDRILEIWNTIKDYPVVKLLMRFNENFKLFLIPYLLTHTNNDNLSSEKVTPIAECFLRLFTLIEIGERGFSAGVFKTFLFNECLKLVDSTVEIETIENDFTEHIASNWNEEDVLEDLKEYGKNILVFLNEYLYAQYHGVTFDFDDSVNVEHIMPASGHNIDAIRSDANVDSVEEFDFLANQLGNKILLEENINKSISNDWFRTKKGRNISDGLGYVGSKYAIAKALSNYESDLWTKDDIKRATDVAAKRITRFIFDNKEVGQE